MSTAAYSPDIEAEIARRVAEALGASTSRCDRVQLDWYLLKFLPIGGGSPYWTMLRAAYAADPTRFTISNIHTSAKIPTHHITIQYLCPVPRSDGTVGTYQMYVHLHGTPHPTIASRLMLTHATARTTVDSVAEQTVALFTKPE